MQSIERQLRAIAEKTKRKQTEVFQASTIRLGQAIISESPVDKGTFKNSWNTAIGAVSYDTSKPENRSGQDSINELVETITDTNIGATAYFSNPQPYGLRLEYDGWSAQAPNGFLRVNTMRWEQIVKEEVVKRK